MKHELTAADIMPMADYADQRRDRARQAAAIKQDRRMEVGPDATFYFESYDTMWFQVHEMLHIEKGGEAQIAGELAAYNPLIPNGHELVATMMIEIEDAERRARVLAALGGIEETISIAVGDEVIQGRAEEDVDRTNAAGKASSVQFLHFPFSDGQIAAFRDPATRVVVQIGHADYAHMAVMSENIRAALGQDFD